MQFTLQKKVLLVELILLTLAFSIGIVFFFKRRNQFPIKGRGAFFIVFFCQINIALLSLSLTILGLFCNVLLCGFDVLWINILTILSFAVYVLRICLLQVNQKISNIYAEYGEQRALERDIVHVEVQKKQNKNDLLNKCNNIDVETKETTSSDEIVKPTNNFKIIESNSLSSIKTVSKTQSFNSNPRIDVSKASRSGRQYQNKIYLKSIQFWTLIFSLICSIQMIPLVSLSPKYFDTTFEKCDLNLPDTIMLSFKIFWGVFFLIGLTYISLFLFIDDAFQLTKELMFTIAVYTMIIIQHSILMQQKNYDNRDEILMFILSFEYFLIFIIGTYVPLIRTVVEERRIQKLCNTKRQDYNLRLKELLSSLKGENDFRRYLIKEFAVENLLFYLRVQQLNINANSMANQQLFDFVDNTYDLYIKNDSKYQVNLSHINRELIEKRLGNKEYTSTIFNEASEEIFRLMSEDSFPRFIENIHKFDNKNNKYIV